MDRMIWVTFQKEGIHKYPAALEDKNLADVKFLGYEHRHMFHFKVWISVEHSNRDIEFIQFKRWLINLYDEKALKLDYKSCEMISDDLARKIRKKYPDRAITIDISEDGENGSYTAYEVVPDLTKFGLYLSETVDEIGVPIDGTSSTNNLSKFGVFLDDEEQDGDPNKTDGKS